MPKKVVRKKVPARPSEIRRVKPGYENGVLVVRRNDKGYPKDELVFKGGKYVFKNPKKKKSHSMDDIY